MNRTSSLLPALIIFLAGFSPSALAQTFPSTQPWRDPDMPLPQRVQSLLSQLTMKEKIALIYFKSPAIPRLGIKALDTNEALHGIVRPGKFTVFPQAIGLAATFDPDLIHQMATAISDEARAKYNQTHGDHLATNSDMLVFFSPVVNMARDPRWGRTQETYGEDPFLTGRIGVAFIRGLQGDDPHYLKVVSTLKHFAGNNQEEDRFAKNIVADQRYLQEYELAPFRACVTQAKPQSVMAAYTAINGVPSSENKWLLTDTLRNQWGFDGFIVSDCGAVSHVVDAFHLVKTPQEAGAACFNAGLDMEGGDFGTYPDLVNNYMQSALDQKLIKPEVIDQAVTRILTVRFKLGIFDPPALVPFSTIPPSAIGSPQHVALARQIADESLVLLKNDSVNGAPLLPIDPSKFKNIIIVGPHAQDTQFGDYSGTPTITPVTPFSGLSSRAKKAGLAVSEIPWKNAKSDPASLKSADLVIAVMGLSTKDEIEGKDRATLNLPKDQDDFLHALIAANPHTVIVLESGSSLAIPWLADHAPAILQAWYPGEEGGDAIADVLFGDINPSGRLPLTFYASDDQLRPITEYDITKGRTYMYLTAKPTFAFGHGLSYTTFRYDHLKLSSLTATDDAHVRVSIHITNTGDRDGSEIIQCYVHAQNPTVPMPIKQLWAFEKVDLQKGHTQTVNLNLQLDTKNFAHWDSTRQTFIVDPGKYDIEVGASSDDIRQTAVLEIKGTKP